MPRKAKYEDMREACIEEAMRIIDSDGIEKLSVREVARRLGVSHQAPYKHFASRDHLLAEILQRAFEDFAAHLDARPRTGDAFADLAAMGLAYVSFATANPLQYRLMFSTPLPDPEEHPAMMEKARYAFDLLREAMQGMAPNSDPDLDALFIWATVHGLAGILQMQMFDQLSVAQMPTSEMSAHVIARIGAGLPSSD